MKVKRVAQAAFVVLLLAGPMAAPGDAGECGRCSNRGESADDAPLESFAWSRVRRAVGDRADAAATSFLGAAHRRPGLCGAPPPGK